MINKKHKFELRSFVKKKISNIIMIMAVMNKTSFRAGHCAKILCGLYHFILKQVAVSCFGR